MSDPGQPATSRDTGSWLITAAGILSVVPFLLYRTSFDRLFWFGDEFDMIDQIDRVGFWKWVWTVFGENVMPLFKAAWGGGVLALGGSYTAMLALVWITHALNAVLLGRLMRACGLPLFAALLAQVVFGLSPASNEVLAWSIQWCSALSVTFLLLALLRFFRRPFGALPALWSAASALVFVRGVLTGFVVALAALWPEASLPALPAGRRTRAALLYCAPAFLALAAVLVFADGNHRRMGGHFGQAAAYAAWCFALNPFRYLLLVPSLGWGTVAVLGALKALLFTWGILRARGPARNLFIALLALDLGYAALLGMGRYHLGLMTSVSPRYQYAALVAAMPVAGFAVASLLGRIRVPAKRVLAAALLIALSVGLCRQWRGEIAQFSSDRGLWTRRVLFVEASPPENAMPGIPFLPVTRAKALVAKYHLH